MAATTFLIDLDGTLWNSFPWYAKLIGADHPSQTRRLLLALEEGTSVVRLINEMPGLSKARFSRLCIAGITELSLYPGVEATLRALESKGIPLGVVTSLPAWICEPMLNELDLTNLFDTFVNASNCRARKPSPAPLLRAIQDLDLTRSNSIYYVGDTDKDALAAKRAGISFAWASYGYGNINPSASTVLDGFADLLKL